MAFMGMRGTGDWVTDQRPKNWRQMMLLLFPEGDMPLNAILSKMPEESTNDPEFNWWTKNLADQGGAVTGIFTNTNLTTAYTSGGVIGQNVFVRTSELVASEFRRGHTVLLRDASHRDMTVFGKVLGVTKNGASSYITVSLVEPDDNGSLTDLSDADQILIVGSSNPEGGPMPDAISYDPVKVSNFTQIFRTPLEITRTAKKTFLRTGDPYKEKKREALQYHGIEMERAFWWGVKSEVTGSNGKLERTTDGIRQFIKTYAPANISDYALDPDFNAETWLVGGERWLDQKLELLARYNTSEWLAFAGSGAVLAINNLAKASGQLNLTPESTSYGLQVRNWITPFKTLKLMIHPLFSANSIDRNTLAILSPSNLKYRYIDDTEFYSDDMHHGRQRIDGLSEEWLTECGLEMHHPVKFMYLTGLGIDNILP
jgi:hypothetical protein